MSNNGNLILPQNSSVSNFILLILDEHGEEGMMVSELYKAKNNYYQLSPQHLEISTTDQKESKSNNHVRSSINFLKRKGYVTKGHKKNHWKITPQGSIVANELRKFTPFRPPLTIRSSKSIL